MSVILTGGTGYIGSHTAVAFIQAGYDVVLADDFRNSNPVVVDRIHQITGVSPALVEIDLTRPEQTQTALASYAFDGVVHFAGLKSVGESVYEPLRYYSNNLRTTLSLLEICAVRRVRRFVFSSSATVYGPGANLPYVEDDPAPQQPTNPYGWSKSIGERILTDTAASGVVDVALLRYFNPAAAHSSGLIGEDPQGPPTNLMPVVTQVAAGRLPQLTIFGNDYPTRDGTCIRDYIHVEDLAAGHVAAWRRLGEPQQPVRAYNLGTGDGTTVLELVEAFERASNVPIPREIGHRRPGDLPATYADPSRASTELGWRAERDLERICTDTWRWHSMNPSGYCEASS